MIGIIFLPQESAGSKIDWDTRAEKYREQVVLLVPARRWKCIWKGEFAAKGYLLPNEANKSYRINKSVAWRCKKGCLMRLNQF